MESMTYFVTASMPSGTREATKRQSALETTTLGADFQTMLKTGGMFPRPFKRSCHRELGGCSIPGCCSMLRLRSVSAAPVNSFPVVLMSPPATRIGRTQLYLEHVKAHMK